MSYQAEADAAIETLRKDGLNAVLDEVLRELRQVSTFTFDGHEGLATAANLVLWLQDVRLGKAPADRPELLYALHLITRSETRHEELNGRTLSLETVRGLLEAKLRLFEHAEDCKFDSLVALADAVREARNGLPADRFVYQAIDGATDRLHRELTTAWVKPDGFETYALDTRKRISQIQTGDDALKVFAEMSSRLRRLSNTDFTLVNGPRCLLEARQDASAVDFFAYLFTEAPEGFLKNTAFNDVADLADLLLPTFQGCMRRYHLEGYQVLMPGIAVNEAIRPEHVRTGHRASLRCAHPVLDRPHQVVDVRCIETGESFEAITPENLSYQRCYTALFAEAVGHCIESGVQLPAVNLQAAAPSSPA